MAEGSMTTRSRRFSLRSSAEVAIVASIIVTFLGGAIYGAIYVGELKGRVDSLDSAAIEATRDAAIQDIDSRLARIDALDAMVTELRSDVQALELSRQGQIESLDAAKNAQGEALSNVDGRVNRRIATAERRIASIEDRLHAYREALTDPTKHENFRWYMGHKPERMASIDEAFCYIDGIRLQDGNLRSIARIWVDQQIGYWMLSGSHEVTDRTVRRQNVNGARIDRVDVNCVPYPTRP